VITKFIESLVSRSQPTAYRMPTDLGPFNEAVSVDFEQSRFTATGEYKWAQGLRGSGGSLKSRDLGYCLILPCFLDFACQDDKINFCTIVPQDIFQHGLDPNCNKYLTVDFAPAAHGRGACLSESGGLGRGIGIIDPPAIHGEG
jgi:hypothetical protein